jgi:hypothetical protein
MGMQIDLFEDLSLSGMGRVGSSYGNARATDTTATVAGVNPENLPLLKAA